MNYCEVQVSDRQKVLSPEFPLVAGMKSTQTGGKEVNCPSRFEGQIDTWDKDDS